jgi:hypothetical protein
MHHAVALVPGFLGFNHRAGTTYFADRLIAGLRARLEAFCGGSIPVIPVTTLPIDSLAERQRWLLRDLQKLDHAYNRPFWHLIGHSAGGLDAALLARTERLATGKHSTFSTAPLLVERLLSVTTLASPHYGTSLALAPLGRMLGGLGITARGVRDLLRTAWDVSQRDARRSRIEFALGSLVSGNGSGFYQRLLFSNRLARDLAPDVAGVLTKTKNRRTDVQISSLATIAPEPARAHPDRLFYDLWSWTAHAAHACGSLEPPPFPEIRPNDVIATPTTWPAVDARANDGVVNTNRQCEGLFAGLIVADHADVLGRYRRADVLDGKLIDPGLLTSGACFDDDRFFALLNRLAAVIADVIEKGPMFLDTPAESAGTLADSARWIM